MSDFINQFPYSDFHEMNLDWIIKEVKRLGEKLDTFVDYNKIKFADPVEWSIARQYEALTLVFDVIWQEVAPGEEIAVRGYNLYMSIKPVPKGINIHNEDYWQLVIPFTIDDSLNVNSTNVVTNQAITRQFNIVDLHIDNANERIDTTNERVGTLSTNLETEIHDRIVDDHELAEAIQTNAANITENTSDITTLTNRVDNLSQTITPGGTTGDAELADIRVGADGITYTNAGTAVRSQISVLNDAVGEDIPLTKSIVHASGINQTLSQFNIALPSGTKVRIKTLDADNTGHTIGLYVRYSGAESNTALNESAKVGTEYTYTLANASTFFSLYASGLTSGTMSYIVTIVSSNEDSLTAKMNEAEANIIDNEHSISDINASLLNNTYKTASRIINTSAHPHSTVLNQSSTQTDISIPANCRITITMSDEHVTGNGALYVRYAGDAENTLLNGSVSMNGSYSFTNTKAVTFFSLYKNSGVTAGTMNITIEYNYLPELVGIPIYYVDHIINKTAAILDNMMTAGKNGETFIFITDLHWENNDKNSPALVRYLLDNLNINYILCGGDLINEGLKDPMSKAMVECIRAFNFKNTFLPCAFGNHDSNKNGDNSSYPERWFDAAAQYALMQKQAENKITYFTDSGWNFYFDSEQTMTRWIICDTTENGSFSNYDELCALLNSTPSGYKIIISGHWFYDSGAKSTFATNLESIIDTYNARSSVIISGVSYDFSNAAAEITFVIGGHMHKDMGWDTKNGIPFILSDCDNGPRSGNTDYPYVKGTVTEQSFDVVTVDYTNQTVKCVRIGRGADRTFTYGNT